MIRRIRLGRARRADKTIRAQAGFTIIELLVAIIAASLVAAGTYTFFAGQQRVYEIQTKMLTLQESLWASLEAVTRYVRSSGAGMNDCVRPDPDGTGLDIGDPPPGGVGPPQTGLRAFFSGVGAFRIAPLWIRNGVAGAPDTITVAYGRGATGNFRDAYLGTAIGAAASTAAITTLAGQTVRFVSGEYILLVHEARTDKDVGCSLFRITDVFGLTNTLDHSVTSPWNATGNLIEVIPFEYPGGSATATGGIRNFGELVWITLAIDAAGAPDVAPRLTMDRLDDDSGPQVLADGIEDLQVAYACDRATGGAADGVIAEGTDTASRIADDWIYNEPGDVEPVNCQRPESVRITLTARTLTPDPSLTDTAGNVRPAAEDGAAGTADLFRHRSVTATVRLRN